MAAEVWHRIIEETSGGHSHFKVERQSRYLVGAESSARANSDHRPLPIASIVGLPLNDNYHLRMSWQLRSVDDLKQSAKIGDIAAWCTEGLRG